MTDQSGAVLPGVSVIAKHVQTGRTAEAVTNGAGQYGLALLQPGTYEVSFVLSGFQSATIKGIELHVNDRLDISHKMGVGGLSETIEVSAAQQFVQSSPAVQNLIGPTQIQELPLNNRVFVQLATLVPGVSSDLPDEVGIGLTSTVSISVNGGRRNAVNWLVDGVSNVDVGSNITLLSTPTLESIQEFKIITSSYAAEWPRSGGGIVNIVTRGGTQKFSGTGYEFFRYDKLNANSFFRNSSTNPDIRNNAPRLRYNNFGYTIGGPMLPSRQKAFFFWSEEWRRIARSPASSTATVVDPAWLNDPTNVNYVDPALRDPNAVKLLALWPQPNSGVNRFINTNPTINNTRQEVIRLDYDWKPGWKIVGRYTHDLSQTTEPGGLFFGVAVPNVAATETNVPGNVFSTEVRTTRGRALNELKYQLSGNKIVTSDTAADRNTRTQFGVSIPELFPENNRDRIPTLVVTGLSTAGTTQGYNIQYWNHTVTDTLTLMRGNHGYKAGIMMAFEQKNEGASNETHGRFSFGNRAGVRTAFQSFLMGNSDGVCGNFCSYSESEIDVTNHLRFNRYEAFAQDTWRIRPNVTLDYGVRYALYPGVKDANNVLSTFVPSLYDPAKAPTFSSSTGGALIPGTGDPTNGLIIAGRNSPYGRQIYATDKNNIMPRAGVSWDPGTNGKMVVRAGYGLYYDQPLVGIFEQNAFVNPPFANSVSLLNPALSNPSAGTAPGTVGLRSLIASSVPFVTPRMQQWNVGMQRQLYRRGFIDVSYVGSHGDHQIQPLDINMPQPADVVGVAGNLNLVRPYQGYTSVTMRQTTAYSNYWGILTQFRHEAGRQGSLTVNYTLSRNRTTSTNDRDAIDFPQNPLDLDIEYADARTDRRHIFTATYVYEFPFFRDAENAVVGALLGGWQASGLTTINSGAPVPRITANTNGGRRGGRASVNGDPKTGTLPFPYWFDPASFIPPADGTYGNSPRAPLRLPGRNQTDLALSKNFYVGDNRLQFRADFINAFNHTQWLGVDAACSAASTVTLNRCDIGGTDTFGQITSTRNPREIQLSLKLYW
ncbi:MAG: hypothetical protein A3H96_01215 [Acidobacteria bacterium RIFCSPLOWO2_02_FULL_67_36]|nr:MAG: hypothetical protein A3H96_01215 [Acidobacteria bacterium RIFCSPLOWO2_02_FULL_67_36]OFW18669.1 MAG: hypothetical protein A3G21_25695 [Acidobacteria bacterium RIFCSPLOWO2_12_FULL_66_21]